MMEALYFCPYCKGTKCMKDMGATRCIYCEICDRDLIFSKFAEDKEGEKK